jgi:hypothetical protein
MAAVAGTNDVCCKLPSAVMVQSIDVSAVGLCFFHHRVRDNRIGGHCDICKEECEFAVAVAVAVAFVIGAVLLLVADPRAERHSDDDCFIVEWKLLLLLKAPCVVVAILAS